MGNSRGKLCRWTFVCTRLETGPRVMRTMLLLYIFIQRCKSHLILDFARACASSPHHLLSFAPCGRISPSFPHCSPCGRAISFDFLRGPLRGPREPLRLQGPPSGGPPGGSKLPPPKIGDPFGEEFLILRRGVGGGGLRPGDVCMYARVGFRAG